MATISEEQLQEMLTDLVNEGVALTETHINTVKQGVHPSLTQTTIEGLEYHRESLGILFSPYTHDENKQKLFKSINRIDSAIAHLQGHNWGEFADYTE